MVGWSSEAVGIMFFAMFFAGFFLGVVAGFVGGVCTAVPEETGELADVGPDEDDLPEPTFQSVNGFHDV